MGGGCCYTAASKLDQSYDNLDTERGANRGDSPMVGTAAPVTMNHRGRIGTTWLAVLRNHKKSILTGVVGVSLLVFAILGWSLFFAFTCPDLPNATPTIPSSAHHNTTPPQHTTTPPPPPPYDAARFGNTTLTDEEWNQWYAYQDKEAMALPDCQPVSEQVIVKDEIEELDTRFAGRLILTVKVVANRCRGAADPTCLASQPRW